MRSSHDPMIPAQNHNHKAYDNLKIKFLTYARQKHDVSSGVTTALKKAGCMEKLRVDKLSHHDLTSFPFAVVELKRKHTPAAGIVTCECQAASASARALSLHRTLYMKSHWGRSDYHERDGYDIPPCVAFTCIGTSVRVWLVYEESRRKDAKVVCINPDPAWKSSVLTSLGHAMHLCNQYRAHMGSHSTSPFSQQHAGMGQD